MQLEMTHSSDLRRRQLASIYRTSGYGSTPTCDRQTDRHRVTAYTALVQRRAVKKAASPYS